MPHVSTHANHVPFSDIFHSILARIISWFVGQNICVARTVDFSKVVFRLAFPYQIPIVDSFAMGHLVASALANSVPPLPTVVSIPILELIVV